VDAVLKIPSQSVAILAVLMLRGPQTPGELRINCDRMHRFADLSALQGFLDELAARPGGALVMELPRQSGARENRWAHLLSGSPPIEAAARDSETPVERQNLEARVVRLEAEVAELRAALEKLRLQ